MEIGIIGLGLIGGSLAKAISQNTDNTVYGYDISDQVVKKAVLVNAIEQPLTDSLLPLIFLPVFVFPRRRFFCFRPKIIRNSAGCINQII